MMHGASIFFHGVRGSYPQSGPDFGIGGHTVCVEYRFKKEDIVSFLFDAGTGIARFSPLLRQRIDHAEQNHLSEKKCSSHRVYIFLTHYHMDHVVGLTLLDSLFDQDVECIIYAPRLYDGGHEYTAQKVFQQFICPPLYPFDFAVLQHKIIFRNFNVGDSFIIEGHTINTLLLEHPGQSCGYRVTLDQWDKSFCYITDVGIKKGDSDYPNTLKNFIKDTKLLIQDAYFNDEDFDAFRHFGHGKYKDVAMLAQSSNVESLALYHHNPKYNDAFLKKMEKDAQAIFNKAFLSREGMEFVLI